MSTPYIGEIRAVGFNFTPQYWAPCNGQLLSINNYQALFSLLGTTYGGDGQTTFGLPNLNSRVAVGSEGGAAGPGLSPYPLGATGGAENVTLNTTQIPPHAHTFTGALVGSTAGPLSDDPAGRRPGVPTGSKAYAGAAQSGQTLNTAGVTGSATAAGSSQPHSNIQPVQALNFIICTSGLFPPRQ
ncbi:phage tail protein [Hymenobacter convexus]|uniref:phage tail protein n=1 Tax=Hymenobacter sp. CA1UV-4 TaxID=3063782 RepID=UPI0027133A50|nr:tail fiber protein [Hymenobacter sp. CA1UV-4]MDO7851420.1 tail fiber protein [Hymenobacter sp. CA1UV-4]